MSHVLDAYFPCRCMQPISVHYKKKKHAVSRSKFMRRNLIGTNSFSLAPCSDHSALHAQVPAARPRHPQGVRRGAVPGQSGPCWGGHAHLLLPGDCVHHCHGLSESTGSAADLDTTTFPPEASTQRCSSTLVRQIHSAYVLQFLVVALQMKSKSFFFQGTLQL